MARVEISAGGCGYQLASHEAGKISIDGQPVVIGTHPALLQPVFICPACRRIRYKLFEVGGRWACYRCHELTHACRHVHRTIPNLHRLKRLRRKIGADSQLFTPIASKPSYATRYWRIVAEIRQLEAGLVQHARRDVCDVIERRHDRSRCHGAGDR